MGINTQVAVEMETLLKSRYKGIVSLWITDSGCVNAVVKSRRVAFAIQLDLIRSGGFKDASICNPDPNNPYCDGNFHLNAKAK